MPITIITFSFISSRQQVQLESHLSYLSISSRIAHQAITAIETVKILCGQDFEKQRYSKAIRNAAKGYNKQARWNALQIGVLRFLVCCIFVIGFFYGNHLVKASTDDPQITRNVMTAFWSCFMLLMSLDGIAPHMMDIEKAKIASKRLQIISDRGGMEKVDNMDQVVSEVCKGYVSFEKVVFSYPSEDERAALKGVDFSIEAGETVFITGSSGSGKSTIANLLLRLWKQDSGHIKVDGMDVEGVGKSWLRKNIMVVQQHNVLFNDTLFRNVSFGSLDPESTTEKQVENACSKSGLDDTILCLPGKYHTKVGINGRLLSGGQRQRVLLARSRIRNCPIVIFDEATSALDDAMKTRIMQDIRKWRTGKTTIFITHDLRQIGLKDKVFVMKDGIIAQTGIKDTLETAVDGPYKALADAIPSEYPPVYQLNDQFYEKSDRWEEGNFMDVTIGADAVYENQVFFPLDGHVRLEAVKYDCALPEKLDDVTDFVEEPDYSTPKHSQWLSPRLLFTPMKAIKEEEGSEIEGKYRLSYITEHDEQKQGLLHDASLIEDDILPNNPKPSLISIFRTVYPALTVQQRAYLILGVSFAFINATCTPGFSFGLAQLLNSFFHNSNSISDSAVIIWTIALFVLALIAATSSYVMHYLLESSARAWIDSLRILAFSRVLEQSRSWFDLKWNKVSFITNDLDKHAEEMRNLLGRFVGYAIVGAVMLSLSVLWSLLLSWRLTLAGLMIAPLMFIIGRFFGSVTSKHDIEKKEEATNLGNILHEVVLNLDVVKGLMLEKYFGKTYQRDSRKAFRRGVKRSIVAGLWFGMADSMILFASGTFKNPTMTD